MYIASLRGIANTTPYYIFPAPVTIQSDMRRLAVYTEKNNEREHDVSFRFFPCDTVSWSLGASCP